VRRRSPRPLAYALATLTRGLEPATPLARVQAAWTATVGEAIAAHCTPLRVRGGVLEVTCDEAVWAAEIELMGPELVERLRSVEGCAPITALRARTGEV
jgi:predicted nucleic acid-binding Zn ribbon protein